MISPEKWLLLVVSAWCILEIVEAFICGMSCRVPSMRVLIQVHGTADFIEQVIRCLLWEIEICDHILPEITVVLIEPTEESRALASLLERDGMVSLGACQEYRPDLFLSFGKMPLS